MKIMVKGLRGKNSLSNYRLTYEGTDMDGFGTVYEPVDVYAYLASSESMQWELKESTERLSSIGTRKMRRQKRLDRMERLGLYKKPDHWSDLDLPF